MWSLPKLNYKNSDLSPSFIFNYTPIYTKLCLSHPISARNSSSFFCPFIVHVLNLRNRKGEIHQLPYTVMDKRDSNPSLNLHVPRLLTYKIRTPSDRNFHTVSSDDKWVIAVFVWLEGICQRKKTYHWIHACVYLLILYTYIYIYIFIIYIYVYVYI